MKTDKKFISLQNDGSAKHIIWNLNMDYANEE
jgi:hypothetical protein